MNWSQYTLEITKLLSFFGKNKLSKEEITNNFKYWKTREYSELCEIVSKSIANNQFPVLKFNEIKTQAPKVFRQFDRPLDNSFLDKHLAINHVSNLWDLIEKNLSQSKCVK